MIGQALFKKVGECLYRNTSSQRYYALLKIRGKQIKRSMGTDDLPEARRKLRDFRHDLTKIDHFAGKMTVDALCDRQLETVRHQAPKTVARKELILRRIRQHWKVTDIARVQQSEIRSWLAGLKLGAPSFNLHLQGIKALFKQAVDDRLLVRSPVDGIKQRKLARPRVAEKEQTISAMQGQIEELRRKSEQGSQQLQGEAFELELESILRTNFARDIIEPVPKGEFGGDILHHVTGLSGQVCGTILWEFKQTKNWSDGWLSKLRADQRTAKAEVAVIVSQIAKKYNVVYRDEFSTRLAALRVGFVRINYERNGGKVTIESMRWNRTLRDLIDSLLFENADAIDVVLMHMVDKEGMATHLGRVSFMDLRAAGTPINRLTLGSWNYFRAVEIGNLFGNPTRSK